VLPQNRLQLEASATYIRQLNAIDTTKSLPSQGTTAEAAASAASSARSRLGVR